MTDCRLAEYFNNVIMMLLFASHEAFPLFFVDKTTKYVENQNLHVCERACSRSFDCILIKCINEILSYIVLQSRIYTAKCYILEEEEM